MLKAKDIAKRFLWNAVMAAVVFLLTFLVMAQVEVLLRVGLPSRTTFLTELSNAIYFYLILLLPVIFVSLVYSLVSLVIPLQWGLVKRRLGAVLLGFLLPGIIILLKLPGDLVYLNYYLSTGIATILYGMCTRIGEETIDSGPMEGRESE
jgi:hypothetical protein